MLYICLFIYCVLKSCECHSWFKNKFWQLGYVMNSLFITLVMFEMFSKGFDLNMIHRECIKWNYKLPQREAVKIRWCLWDHGFFDVHPRVYLEEIYSSFWNACLNYTLSLSTIAKITFDSFSARFASSSATHWPSYSLWPWALGIDTLQ